MRDSSLPDGTTARDLDADLDDFFEPTHDIYACYSNGPNGLERTLECSCGFTSSYTSWEKAGRAMDGHLFLVNKKV